MDWSQPPAPHQARRTEYMLEQAELREHPGEWAKIREYGSYPGALYLARRVNAGESGWEPKGAWEAVARALEESSQGQSARSGVWARYVGAREPSDDQEDHSPGEQPGQPHDSSEQPASPAEQ